jgi:RNA polymerase sigma-70 factor (ECF subfamily)
MYSLQEPSEWLQGERRSPAARQARAAAEARSERTGTGRYVVTEQELSELMLAYQRGDVAAFDGLYWALKPRLSGYLSLLTRSRSSTDDLLQETFLQIHRSRRTYLPGRPVVPWAFAIARHVYLADARTRMRVMRREVALDEPPPEIPVPAEAEGLAERERLQRALRQLPSEQVEAVVLHEVWGFTFEEIGAILAIRGVTAKVRAFRGMRRLRNILGTGL